MFREYTTQLRRFGLFIALLFVMSLAFLVWQPTVQPDVLSAVQSVTQSPRQVVQRAWRLAQEAGVYRYRTEIVQTTYPAPTLANVGHTSRQDSLYLEGETDLAQRTMQMTLYQNGGSVLDTGSRPGRETSLDPLIRAN